LGKIFKDKGLLSYGMVGEFLGTEMGKDVEKCHHSHRCYRQRRVEINPGLLWKVVGGQLIFLKDCLAKRALA